MAESRNEFKSVKLENILFLDIETVSQKAKFEQLSEQTQILWEKKTARLGFDSSTPVNETYGKAAMYAEFGRIICISAGFLQRQANGSLAIRIKTFSNDDEVKLLTEFNELVTKHFDGPEHYLCAHNGKEFDFPYIARRSLIHALHIPNNLDTRGLKPWEVKHFDTMELWRFGDYKNYTSLETLTHIFNIPTPKDDISGSQVGQVYWQQNDLQRIVTYCQKDVVAIIQLFLKYKQLELVNDDDIRFV